MGARCRSRARPGPAQKGWDAARDPVLAGVGFRGFQGAGGLGARGPSAGAIPDPAAQSDLGRERAWCVGRSLFCLPCFFFDRTLDSRPHCFRILHEILPSQFIAGQEKPCRLSGLQRITRFAARNQIAIRMITALYAGLHVVESEVVAGEYSVAIDASVVVAQEYVFAS